MNSVAQSPPESDALSGLRDDANLSPIAAEMLWTASRSEDPAAWLAGRLPGVCAVVGGEYAAVAAAAEGRWNVLGETGTRQSLPIELLADVADGETARTWQRWAAVPMATRAACGEVFAVYCSASEKTAQVVDIAGKLAPVLHAALETVRSRRRRRDRVERLEAILEIANQWYRTREVEPLLVEMAEAATRLLGADRASIFLWDRPNKTLIGRPALGIEGGELRIPDDRGVVSQVIHSGQPRRVDATVEPNEISHDVDAKLDYQTETLLCVPLHGRKRELFGAFEVLNKLSGSFTSEDETALMELAAHAAVALENAQDRQQLLLANRQIAEQAAGRVKLIGNSPAIEALRSITHRVADTDLAVLILGDNGTGKEVVAQSIHYLSRRRDQPFVAVNCAAIPDTLAESELFGHEKGAFTDAREARAGKFELADGGTLFLDEIGDLSLSGQAKLLRVLEEKVLVRVGGSVPIHTDARVLTATNQNLAEMVREKRFREDLYFRLNVVTLELPPLRDRGDDVLLLAEYFLGNFCNRTRRAMPRFSDSARSRLLSHPWPGNVRELRNLMERLAYLSSEEVIAAEDLAFILSPRGAEPTAAAVDQPLTEATAEFQIEYIRQAIDQSNGNVSLAAETLGLHRSNLYRKMRQLGMEP
ncbi:MAG: sigma-54-dependent Fis family transcriptional regulator [Candidatus Nealsonbacteria bacterium]|nr:sigma-54-dependent Fis family transcriptional regulator [Candidatus Nealsonbacteria bacterium]